MTLRYTYPDAETAVKAWARTLGIVGTRVFLGLPAKASAYPIVVVQRVGGGPLPGDTPVDGALLQLEVWGRPPDQGSRGGQDRATVAAAAHALADQVASLVPGTRMGTAAVSGGAEVTRSPTWSPDPDDRQGRYLLDGVFYLRSA